MAKRIDMPKCDSKGKPLTTQRILSAAQYAEEIFQQGRHGGTGMIQVETGFRRMTPIEADLHRASRPRTVE